MPFQKGHAPMGGRPAKAKNKLPKIRDRVFYLLEKRLRIPDEMDKVSTEALLKFASACLPKDMSLSVVRPPEINYISSVPRPQLEQAITDGLHAQATEAIITQAIDTTQVK